MKKNPPPPPTSEYMVLRYLTSFGHRIRNEEPYGTSGFCRFLTEEQNQPSPPPPMKTKWAFSILLVLDSETKVGTHPLPSKIWDTKGFVMCEPF